MSAPIGNQYAKGNKGGNPGTGKLNRIRENVEKFSSLWWNTWEAMMESTDKQEKFEAMREFNKLQCKMIPQDVNNNLSGGLTVVFDKAFKNYDNSAPQTNGDSPEQSEI